MTNFACLLKGKENDDGVLEVPIEDEIPSMEMRLEPKPTVECTSGDIMLRTPRKTNCMTSGMNVSFGVFSDEVPVEERLSLREKSKEKI